MINWRVGLSVLLVGSAVLANASMIMYGDEDVLGTGSYGSDPTAGATLEGLAPDVVTNSTVWLGHGFPFAPSGGDYPGTDQIYVGSNQTGGHDGYSGYGGRIAGPQIITMDYSSLVGSGQSVKNLTLGIGTDDFQNAVFGQPFTAWINGVQNTTLTNTLNALNETGPVVHFLTIGIDPTLLNSNNSLELKIDEGGDGGDGWAIDYLTIGVQTQAVPEPASMAALGLGAVALLKRRSRKLGR